MSKTEITTTNKKILHFYNTNPIFNFDVMNELLVDVLQEITKHITGTITNNMSHKLNRTLSLQSTELNDIKTQLTRIVNDNLNKTQFYKDLNKDLFNQLLLQLHELKKDNITNFKELIANNQNTQLHNIIELIPKNNTLLLSQIQNILTNSHTNNQLFTNLEHTIHSYINSTENRISTNINEIKNIANNTSIAQNKINNDLDTFLDKYKNSSFKGSLAENHIEHILTSNFPSADITRTANTDHSGDFIMTRNNLPTILFEIKNYNRNIPTDEINKFTRDINHHKINGIFISISTGIAKKNNFQIDINDNNNILVYIHHMNYDEHKLHTAVDIIDNLTSKLALYNNKDITLTQQTIDAINKEYQTFINKKIQLSDHLKDTHKKSLTIIDDIELKTLNTFLSTHFSFMQSSTLKCNKCNKFIGTNKKSLAVHKRKCNSTTSDSNTE
jgi:hypothetical protein